MAQACQVMGKPVCTASPLVAHFRTEKDCYIYEAATNEILRVPESFWNMSQRRSFWESDSPPSRAKTAWAKARKEGLLLPGLPTKMTLALDPAAYTQKAGTGLNQLILCITEKCNLRCGYCLFSEPHPGQRQHSSRSMSFDIAQKAVDFFLARSNKADHRFISFYGGEPTLNFPVVRQVVAHVRNQAGPDVGFNMTTNGYGLSRTMMAFLVQHGFSLLVSLDGPADRHDAWRRTRKNCPTHGRVVSALKRLRAMAPDYYTSHVRLSIVIAPPYELSRLRDYFDSEPLFQGLGFNISTVSRSATHFFALPLVTAAMESPLPPETGFPGMFRAYVRNIADKDPYGSRFLAALFESRFLRLHKRIPFAGYGDHLHANGICEPGIRRLYVAVDGTFKICERVDDSLTIGDLGTGIDLDKVFHILGAYTALNGSRCLRCMANRLCPLCFATDFSLTAFNPEQRRSQCRQICQDLIETLTAYCAVREQDPGAFDFMDGIDFG